MGRTSCNVARSFQVSSTLMLPLPLDRAGISFASSGETASGRNCVSYDRAGLMNLQGPLPFLNFHNIRVQCKVFDNVVDILMHHLVSIFSDLQPCIVIRIVVIRVILRTFALTV